MDPKFKSFVLLLMTITAWLAWVLSACYLAGSVHIFFEWARETKEPSKALALLACLAQAGICCGFLAAGLAFHGFAIALRGIERIASGIEFLAKKP